MHCPAYRCIEPSAAPEPCCTRREGDPSNVSPKSPSRYGEQRECCTHRRCTAQGSAAPGSPAAQGRRPGTGLAHFRLGRRDRNAGQLRIRSAPPSVTRTCRVTASPACGPVCPCQTSVVGAPRRVRRGSGPVSGPHPRSSTRGSPAIRFGLAPSRQPRLTSGAWGGVPRTEADRDAVLVNSDHLRVRRRRVRRLREHCPGERRPALTEVTATSPTTGGSYIDDCQNNESTQVVLCSHGKDLIQFPEWAAAVYNG
jgi:hypothetical protein